LDDLQLVLGDLWDSLYTHGYVGVNSHVHVLSNAILFEGVPIGVKNVSNYVKQCVLSNHMKLSIFPTCILPQLQFYLQNDISLCFKDTGSTYLYPGFFLSKTI
jgi:hypothetical protein